jgi:hypothetical protein
MEIHPEAVLNEDRREGWLQTVDDRTAVAGTLPRVIAAIDPP